MNILIKNISAWLPDSFSTVVTDVCAGGGKILSVGSVPAGFQPEKTIDGSGKLLIPGLVNAHTHSYMTVFRNYADDLSFNDWLFGRILPLEDRLTADDCYWGTLLGCMEMLSTGTTSFLDMYIFPHSIARAVCDCGMRAVLSRGLTDGDGSDPEGGRRRINEALDEFNTWKDKPNVSFMLAPHAPYTCSESYQREIAEVSRSTGMAINLHLAESESESQTIREKYGCTPTELFDRTGLLTGTTVAAHCVKLSDGDIDILASRGVSVATNPVSNLKLANGIARIPDLLNAGVNVALGTDGTASNNTLNMFRELSFLTLLRKGLDGNPKAVSAETGLKAATLGGARALGIDAGVIAEGKLADLTVIDLDRVNLFPVNNALSSLAYSANGSEVETVIVGGEVLYEKGEFKTIDRERVMFEVENICKRIGMR